MAVTTIPWGDGSGDNIYLSRDASEGNQTVSVSSDANTGAARTKTVTFSAVGVTPVTLTVNQAAGAVEQTFTGHPVSYDSQDYSYYSISNIENGYTDSNSTTYATINPKRGKNAETWIYFSFDTSAIPNGATIVSVTCKAKAKATNTGTSNFQKQTLQMCAGTTLKGSSSNLSTSATERTLMVGDWTLSELRNARVKLYALRNTGNVNTGYAISFYGATLTIKYTV